MALVTPSQQCGQWYWVVTLGGGLLAVYVTLRLLDYLRSIDGWIRQSPLWVRKNRFYFDLLPHEHQELRNHLEDLGIEEQIQYLKDPSEISKAQFIVVSRGAVRRFQDHQELLAAQINGIPIVDWRVFISHLQGRVDVDHTDFWSFLVFARRKSSFVLFYLSLKMILEPLLAAVLFVFLAPVFLIIAIGIKLSDPGPIFYSQLRSGFRGRPFYLHKFRTMYTDAEKNGPQWCSSADARIYPMGQWLRKTRLDEIPQLWNIALGELSFIGPRPERPEFYKKLKSEIPLFDLRTEIIPGVTGWAQTVGGYASTVEQSKQKLEYDLYYIKNASPKLDILILFKTIEVVWEPVLRYFFPKVPKPPSIDRLSVISEVQSARE